MKWFIYIFSVFSLGLSGCEKSPEQTDLVMEDGRFWADLLVMPEEDLSEFEKPTEHELKISVLSKVEAGDRVALKLLFSAMELDEASSADVSFNTEMIRPNGTLSEAASHKNLPARKGRVEAPLNVHNSDAVLILTFDPDDQRGTYVINVLASDNIGGGDIAIRKELVLTD